MSPASVTLRGSLRRGEVHSLVFSTSCCNSGWLSQPSRMHQQTRWRSMPTCVEVHSALLWSQIARRTAHSTKPRVSSFILLQDVDVWGNLILLYYKHIYKFCQGLGFLPLFYCLLSNTSFVVLQSIFMYYSKPYFAYFLLNSRTHTIHKRSLLWCSMFFGLCAHKGLYRDLNKS